MTKTLKSVWIIFFHYFLTLKKGKMALQDNANLQETASSRDPNVITVENPVNEGGLGKITVVVATCGSAKMTISYDANQALIDSVCALIPTLILGTPYNTFDLFLVCQVAEMLYADMGVLATFTTLTEKGGGGG